MEGSPTIIPGVVLLLNNSGRMEGVHHSPKASGMKTLGWALYTTKTKEDQTIEYHQQAQ
jgi:hypothetical protein